MVQKKLYHTRMVIPYEYTRTVYVLYAYGICTIRVRYELRVRYTTYIAIPTIDLPPNVVHMHELYAAIHL